jgi:hypothetical protein
VPGEATMAVVDPARSGRPPAGEESPGMKTRVFEDSSH